MTTLKILISVLGTLFAASASMAVSPQTVDEWVFMNKQFHNDLQCQTLSIPFSPYHILNSDLSSTQQFLKKGSFVDLNKKRIIRSWNHHSEQNLNLAIPDSLLDPADQWKIIIVATETDNLPFELDGKILEIQKVKDRYLVKNCCINNKCQVLPTYKVYEQNKEISTLSFHPKTSLFLKNYKLIDRHQILSQPQAQTRLRPATAPQTPPTPQPPFTDPSETSTATVSPPGLSENVVCTRQEPLNVYDDSLERVIYRAKRFQVIQVFQGWDGKSLETLKGSTRLLKIKIQNAQGREIQGWAAASSIQRASKCEGFGLVGSPTGETLIDDTTIVVDNNPGNFRFPTAQKPLHSYSKGQHGRYFGAGRSGRLHAAADLFRPVKENIFAVTHGTVLRKYLFYRGTYAIEVQHDSGHVIRYGEVAATDVPKAKQGDRLVKGQHIGYIGHLNMLHFEMFSGEASGPLTQRGANSFHRRKDIMDPTPLLQKWEQETF